MPVPPAELTGCQLVTVEPSVVSTYPLVPMFAGNCNVNVSDAGSGITTAVPLPHALKAIPPTTCTSPGQSSPGALVCRERTPGCADNANDSR